MNSGFFGLGVRGQPITHYHLLDVFTDTLFGGNPLAVFPNALGMEAALMQRIAAELGLSESVFAVPSDRPGIDYRLRIFTPRMELPFAGHPTIGAAVLLASLPTASLSAQGVTLHLEVQAGVVPVRVEPRPNGGFAELAAPEVPRTGPAPPPSRDLAALIGVAETELAAGPNEPCTVSAGVPFLVIRVKDTAALAKVSVDLSHWRQRLAGWWAPHVYVICDEGDRRIRARMFAPAMGINEDAATGGAVAALPAYLARRFDLASGSYEWTVLQGIEMGRPSRLDLRFDVEPSGPTRIRVGAAALRVGQGALFL